MAPVPVLAQEPARIQEAAAATGAAPIPANPHHPAVSAPAHADHSPAVGAAPAVSVPSATADGSGATAAPAASTEHPASAGEGAQEGPLAPARSAGGPARPHDLSPLGMFLAADWVVKAVMIGLASASVVTWTIWIVKSFELARARRTVARALAALRAAPTLAAAARAMEQGRDASGGAAAKVVETALAEWRLSAGLPAEGVKERVIIALNRIEAAAGRSLAVGTGVLASIGSVAPFVGLFGTVWGIMNAFIGISKAQTTNLAVVAPGIAEALLATALGLVAAIPAVVIYNVFARAISGYKAALADTSAEALRHLSRDLDRAAVEADPVRLRAAAE